MSDDVPAPRFFRFSLLNLLFLTAVVALSITVGMLWRDVGPLRAEVRRLREETGQLFSSMTRLG